MSINSKTNFFYTETFIVQHFRVLLVNYKPTDGQFKVPAVYKKTKVALTKSMDQVVEQTINDAKLKGVVSDISKEVRDFIRKFVMFQRLEFDRAESAVNFRSRRNKKDRKLSEVRKFFVFFSPVCDKFLICDEIVD